MYVFLNAWSTEEFTLRLLANLSKEKNHRINKEEFINYLVYLMNDGRYDDLMKIKKVPGKTIDNNNANIFARHAVRSIENRNYCRTVDTKEGKELILFGEFFYLYF